ncbi:MAG: DUF3320 domain-containing protein [Dysgonamonadaceae bacterium]|jgi:hypothetical protein|nr:DUF3320 domain-containing protein [Dysgonamonadaceae bacterium]
MDNSLKVDFICLPSLNFAIQQNKASAIRSLSVENRGDSDIYGLTAEIKTEPEFAQTLTINIDLLPTGKTLRFDNAKLQLSTAFFSQLTERIAGSMEFSLKKDGETIYSQTNTVDILAFDQWGGTAVLPEMLAAFSTPNHPALTPLLKRASAIMEKWTGNASLDEYQSRNPDRVRKQMAAVYTAIAEQNIAYCSVPASFEKSGQRVRLVDAVLTGKMGNCLDISLLYASCLEAIGIHPLIIIAQGHAFAGGWLYPETFPDCVSDDVSFLNKRIADGVNEIALVEATCMNQGNDAGFEQAVKSADKNLTEPSEFVMALDVKRCRLAGIKPLPQRILRGSQWIIEETGEPAADKSLNRPESVNPYDLSAINQEIRVTKQLLWERKLLDLSLRNNLLNTRITKNTLQLIPSELHSLEDALAKGDEFRILPRPADWDCPANSFGLFNSPDETSPIVELVRSEISQKRLRSYLSEDDLARSLNHLYRSSRLSMEENGANTLYITLGLMKWFETPSSERPRYAPLLLFPVEIIRKSAAKGYVIRAREEDTMMNITLLEMLRQTFGILIPGLDPLPTDENGLDVRLIFSIIRQNIKNQARWDVEEQALLGIFSFNKFIMWNDIHNNAAKLLENKVVSSLVSGKLEWNVEAEETDAASLEKTMEPTELVLPIGADSSQLEAVYEAVNGRSYILHGPPGTGKSQTITNIIANALYRGKRVLFVAEKMAALSVVQNRLKNIGLAPFCLELHSNKVQKSAVISQLKQTTEVVRLKEPENFRQEAERLGRLRNELNAYIEILHRKYPFGISLYEAITRYLSIKCGDESLFDEKLFANLTKSMVQEWQDAAESLESACKVCGHPHGHPLSEINAAQFSSQLKTEAEQVLRETLALLPEIKAKNSLIVSMFGLPEQQTPEKEQLKTASVIIDKLLNIPELTPKLLLLPRLSEALDELAETARHGKIRDSLKQEICADFQDIVLTIPAKDWLAEWQQAETKWFIPKFFGQRNIRNRLKVYALKPVSNPALTLKKIADEQEEERALKPFSDLQPLFGRFGKREHEDWPVIERIINDCREINSAISRFAKDMDTASKIKEKLASQLAEGISSFKDVYEVKIKDLPGLPASLQKKENRLTSLLGISHENFDDSSRKWIETLENSLNRWLANLDRLKDWTQWLTVRNRLRELQIGFIADVYREKNIPTNKVSDFFNKSFYHSAILFIIAKNPMLEMFNGKIFDETIQKYRRLNSQFENLVRKELYARLASNLPNFTIEAAQNSEVGILQRNIRNNARGISIRKLFDQIPALLPRMCPCMLMSPISVAQYIDVYAEKFDLIIFDEASQMPTCEAVGAIARGKNVVIVGDPRQMPPTSFFNVNVVDEDNIEMEDLESILDDCLALSMPSKFLLWHYRSRHESLIAFSNAEFYENKLFTFPSPDNIESKVRFVPVEGFYDKGKSRQNKAEAQKVVDEIIRRLSDRELRKKSIGVVTFSSAQQTLVEDTLSDMFVFHPDLESFALDREEPLFIKNLENVQGDERDVILFSVGYGPDSRGNVSMNFGPLNFAGGERRLNVAVSRARYDMIIFSTLQPEMIDLRRTSAAGAAALKRFLEYARQKDVYVPDRGNKQSDNQSVEYLIADELRRLGYTVHVNIGSSGYRIDIGVVDPKNPSRYLLGILCDGENYYQAKTARDREIVQTEALRLLGWNICRVWTMDWWDNRTETLNRLLERIKQAEENKIPVQEEIKEPQEENTAQDVLKSAAKRFPFQLNSAIPMPKSREKKYSSVFNSNEQYTPEMFYSAKNRYLISDMTRKIIDTEAPVSKSFMLRKIAPSFGISSINARAKENFDSILHHSEKFVEETDASRSFYWKSREQYETCDFFRTGAGRDIADISPVEIANAMKQILTEQISLPRPDLLRLTARIFGCQRLTAKTSDFLDSGLKEGIRRNLFKSENGRIVN